MDLEDNLSIPNSWISVKALRNAADIKETFKRGYHRKTVSSPSGSPNKSAISVEVKANSPISNTIHFNSLHSRYNTATLDICPPQFELSDTFEKKYISNIARLNEEILIMSTQLKQANETIAMLTHRLNDSNSKHALHLQSLQERHEQKIRRNRQDMENLMKEMHSKTPSMSLEKIILDKNLEIEVQKRKFQENIEDLAKKYESQLEAKEKQHRFQCQTLKDQFLDIVLAIKDRFFEEISTLQGQYQLEIDRVRYSLDSLNQGKGFYKENINENLYNKPKNQEDSDEDLEIIEELSSTPEPYIKKPIRDYGESDLDTSLRFLINQINIDHDPSITEILRN